ncbi:MAG: hypothetical protein HY681_14455 [Chloroflexi bacterium]|nr:hypothetical protein [Chloroflexota bacterium]
MEENKPANPSTTLEEAALLEAQLTEYAKDLQDLFLEYRDLSQASHQTLEMFQRRAHEVSALNDFLRKRMAELFELEAAHEALVEQLDRILYRIQPAAARESVQDIIWEARKTLERLREGRKRPAS